MAQRQFTTHEYDVVSFELREAMLGMLNPGRYCGYDAIAADGAPNGTIPLNITHALTGIQKGSNATPPVLSSRVGVSISTQGTIVHEDSSVSVAPTKNTDADYERLDLVYMDHAYVQVAGTNPATYGIKTGTPGTIGVPAVEPALDSPNRQIVIGVIRHSANSTTVANLTWEPRVPTVGDNTLFEKLFGTAAKTMADAGATPVIGDRSYTDQYVLTDGESLAVSLDNLDQEANLIDAAVTALGNRAIDSDLWGALTDITTQDASIVRHGLLPKLSGSIDDSFRGDGTFQAISKKIWVWRTGAVTSDFGSSDFGNFVAANGILDLSSVVPAGADIVYFNIWGMVGTIVTDEWGFVDFKSADVAGVGPDGGMSGINFPPTTGDVASDSIMMGMNADRKVYWYQTNATNLGAIFAITILGWQIAV